MHSFASRPWFAGLLVTVLGAGCGDALSGAHSERPPSDGAESASGGPSDPDSPSAGDDTRQSADGSPSGDVNGPGPNSSNDSADADGVDGQLNDDVSDAPSGSVDNPDDGVPDPGIRPAGDDRFALGPSALRRLTRAEAAATMEDLFGASFDASDVELLPGDSGGGDSTPFDNDYTQQSASSALVEAIKAIAENAAQQYLDDVAVRDELLPCAPAGPDDTACLREFAADFGRRVLRRPLTGPELDRLAGLLDYGVGAGDFHVAAALVIRVLLQDMEFWYRVQIGTAVTDVPDGSTPLVRLNDYEVASRLSYLVSGSAPDVELLAAAERGELSSPDAVRSEAERLLGLQRARERVNRFHAMWLGYENSNLATSLLDRMRRESDALIERVVFDEQTSWFDLFRSTETFVDQTLAEHYGLEASIGDSPEWVSYGDTGRVGLLSHGAFLSAFGKFQDTSPTQRGILIRERLACQPIPLPPPGLEVNVDEPPGTSEGGSDCKVDRYAAHREEAGCASCHEQMDPIGFGLEQYDNQGRFRTAEPDNPECEISGDGELVGVGTFNGPAELGELLIGSGLLEGCVARQFYRFAMGRFEDDADEDAIANLGTSFADGQRFDQLIIDFVSLPAFGYRVVE